MKTDVMTLNTKDCEGKEPHYQDRIYDVRGMSTALTAFAPPLILEVLFGGKWIKYGFRKSEVDGQYMSNSEPR